MYYNLKTITNKQKQSVTLYLRPMEIKK